MSQVTINEHVASESQAVCESRESDRVMKFLTGDKFTTEIQQMMWNGDLWGVYYDGDDIVAEDRQGEVYRNILQ